MNAKDMAHNMCSINAICTDMIVQEDYLAVFSLRSTTNYPIKQTQNSGVILYFLSHFPQL